jgi:CRISPR-associated protein Cas5h
VKKTQKADKESAPEKATLNLQEWLWQPHFHLHIALTKQPDLLNELVDRVQNRRWYFCPCMGLSELLADVEFLDYSMATKCAEELVEIKGLCPKNAIEKVIANQEQLGIQLLRLPYHVTPERVFEHRSYYLEYQGRPFSVKSDKAFELSGKLAGMKVIFS